MLCIVAFEMKESAREKGCPFPNQKQNKDTYNANVPRDYSRVLFIFSIRLSSLESRLSTAYGVPPVIIRTASRKLIDVSVNTEATKFERLGVRRFENLNAWKSKSSTIRTFGRLKAWKDRAVRITTLGAVDRSPFSFWRSGRRFERYRGRRYRKQACRERIRAATSARVAFTNLGRVSM